MNRGKLTRQFSGRRRRWLSGVLLLVFTGCTIPHQGTNLLAPQPARSRVGGTAWIADIEVPESERGIQDALLVSVVEYTRGSGYFDQVKALPRKPASGDYVLHFKFDHFGYSKRIYPLYFPAAVLTLTMYIWFGGTITIEEYDIHGTLAVTSPTGDLLAQSQAHAAKTESQNLYSKRYRQKDIPEVRTAVIRDLLDRAVAELARGKGRP